MATLGAPQYSRRIVDDEIAEIVAGLPAVLVTGAKGIGKTATAKRYAHTVLDLSNPATLELVQADRQAALNNNPPVLIDEWQIDPDIWNIARHQIDENPEPGRFIFTGSANVSHARLHSGAGRIVQMQMRPMSFAERGIEQPTVSLSALIAGDAVITGKTEVSLATYVSEIVRSGFPGIRRHEASARKRLLKSYVDTALTAEVVSLGFTPKRPIALKSWFKAYAAAISTTASYNTIADAVGQDVRPTKVTAENYREALAQLYLLEPVPGFLLSANKLNELGLAPKHQLCDPALAVAALGLSEEALLAGQDVVSDTNLRNGAFLGFLFESLVTLSLRVYAQANGFDVGHVRTHRGNHEIDLIAYAEDGTAVAVEVKLGQNVSDADVKHLHWLKEQMGDRLKERVVVNTGAAAYRRADGVAVVPLALLGV